MSVNETNALVFYLKLLIERKLFVIITVIVSIIISVIVALWLPPIYRSSVLMVPTVQNTNSSGLSSITSQFGGLAEMGGISLPGAGVSETAKSIAFLESRKFHYQIITELNLTPLIFHEMWDDRTGKWLVSKEQQPTLWDAHKEFQDLFSVEEDKMNGLITLSIDWGDAETASLIANTLVSSINNQLREDAVFESDRNLKFLYDEVQNTQVIEIRNALNQLIEIEMKKSMLANSTAEFAFKVIDPAIAAQERIKPKRALIVVLGILLGLFFSIFYIIMYNSYTIFKENELTEK